MKTTAIERKKSGREAVKMTVKCWLMDRNYTPILADYIPALRVENRAGGMVLEWPLWWKCKGCPHLEQKYESKRCVVKECPFDNTSNLLIAAALLKIYDNNSKKECYAKVIWIKEKEDCCHIGVSFSA